MILLYQQDQQNGRLLPQDDISGLAKNTTEAVAKLKKRLEERNTARDNGPDLEVA